MQEAKDKVAGHPDSRHIGCTLEDPDSVPLFYFSIVLGFRYHLKETVHSGLHSNMKHSLPYAGSLSFGRRNRYRRGMSEMCYRCFRPKSNCLCPYTEEADTGIKFVILMHPKEAFHQRTGTGRLTQLCLKESEILVGVDFTSHSRLNMLLSDCAYFPLMLYPGSDALNASSPLLKGKVQTKKLLVVVVDATWFLAAKMVRLSKNLHHLPKISFIGGYHSQFAFKREPEPHCLSTIESCYYLVKELQGEGIAKQCNVEAMMGVFHKMVEHQIACEKKRRMLEGDGPQHPWRHDRDNC